jgi:uncharacterized protein
MITDAAGIGFPFQIDPETGRVTWATGRDKIRHNIRIILSTRTGERPMQRDFGTGLPGMVHDPNDDILAELAQTQATQALLQYEPRVLVTGAQVRQHEGEMTLALQYVFISEPATDEVHLALR